MSLIFNVIPSSSKIQSSNIIRDNILWLQLQVMSVGSDWSVEQHFGGARHRNVDCSIHTTHWGSTIHRGKKETAKRIKGGGSRMMVLLMMMKQNYTLDTACSRFNSILVDYFAKPLIIFICVHLQDTWHAHPFSPTSTMTLLMGPPNTWQFM